MSIETPQSTESAAYAISISEKHYDIINKIRKFATEGGIDNLYKWNLFFREYFESLGWNDIAIEHIRTVEIFNVYIDLDNKAIEHFYYKLYLAAHGPLYAPLSIYDMMELNTLYNEIHARYPL